eukprot:752741-Hanusia_phi.AAC.3
MSRCNCVRLQQREADAGMEHAGLRGHFISAFNNLHARPIKSQKSKDILDAIPSHLVAPALALFKVASLASNSFLSYSLSNSLLAEAANAPTLNPRLPPEKTSRDKSDHGRGSTPEIRGNTNNREPASDRLPGNTTRHARIQAFSFPGGFWRSPIPNAFGQVIFVASRLHLLTLPHPIAAMALGIRGPGVMHSPRRGVGCELRAAFAELRLSIAVSFRLFFSRC